MKTCIKQSFIARMNSGDMMCRPGASEMMVGMIDALANSAPPCTGIYSFTIAHLFGLISYNK